MRGYKVFNPDWTCNGYQYTCPGRFKMEEAAGEEATRSIYEALVNDLDEEGNLSYDSNIRISGENTVGYLQQAGFSWEEIGKEYVQGYIRYFRELGYLQ